MKLRSLLPLSLSMILVLLLAPTVNAQVCNVIGQAVICQPLTGGPPTIQQQLSPQQGVVVHPDGQVSPYTILIPPPPPQLRSLQAPPPVLVIPAPSVLVDVSKMRMCCPKHPPLA